MPEFEATARGHLKTFDGVPVYADAIVIPRKTMDMPFPLLYDEKVQITLTAVVGKVIFEPDRSGRLVRKHVLEIDSYSVKEDLWP